MIIEEFLGAVKESGPDKPYYLILLSAKNDDSLTLDVRKLFNYLTQHSTLALGDLSYTLAARREHYNYRCALIVSSMSELLAALRAVTEARETPNVWRSEGKIQLNPVIDSSAVFEQLKLNIESYFNGLTDLAERYIQGAEINWSKLFQNEACHLIELPSYSFMRQTYWSTVAPTSIAEQRRNGHIILSASFCEKALPTVAPCQIQEILRKKMLRMTCHLLIWRVSRNIY